MNAESPIALGAHHEGHVLAWHAAMDMTDRLPARSWCVVGGGMVALHCAERNQAAARETWDVDAMLDARAYPDILMRFTTALMDVGFRASGESVGGHQHRWLNGQAMIDVLLPNGISERTAQRRGAQGGTTLRSPGGRQALDRSEKVLILVGNREGYVYRPSLLGALVGKAAAHGIATDRRRDRHLIDLAILLSLVSPRDDFSDLTARDRRYLRPALAALKPRLAELAIEHADAGLARVEDALEASETAERMRKALAVPAGQRSRPTRTVCGVRSRYMHGPCVKPLGHDPREGHSSV